MRIICHFGTKTVQFWYRFVLYFRFVNKFHGLIDPFDRQRCVAYEAIPELKRIAEAQNLPF